jgi:hypothetical protein
VVNSDCSRHNRSSILRTKRYGEEQPGTRHEDVTKNVRYVGTYEKTRTLTLVIVHADGSITGPEVFTACVVNPPPLCG